MPLAGMRNRRRWVESGPPLWVMPAAAIGLALVLGATLSRVRVPRGSLLDEIAFKGSEGDARQLLAVVTGTMITVTSLVFALTVATLQIASTQYSPRLLRSFLRDRGTQLVMSVLVGTDAYSLAGLQGVGELQRGDCAAAGRQRRARLGADVGGDAGLLRRPHDRRNPDRHDHAASRADRPSATPARAPTG
jgi:uncharacterized membrane protein